MLSMSSNSRCLRLSIRLTQPKSYVTVSNLSSSKSHYDSLGITPHATQTDIKAAYYKLSKMYHPDVNKGSDSALQKFREISSAYEVLGNFKLRRLYDKGILHTAGDKYSEQSPPVEDDPTTKFYKSRFERAKAPTMSGKTPIYDFDEWSQAHYGASFARREAAKQKFNEKASGVMRDVKDTQKEMVIYSVSFFVMIFFVFSWATRQDYDIVVEPTAKLNDNKVPDRLASISIPSDKSK